MVCNFFGGHWTLDKDFAPGGRCATLAKESPKIGQVPILSILYSQLQGIYIPIKNKKVMLIESYVMPKNQKSWFPPLVVNVQIRQGSPEMYRAQNFSNLLYFLNLLKNLKFCGLNKPKSTRIDFGLFFIFLEGFTAEFCILNHEKFKIFSFLKSSR